MVIPPVFAGTPSVFCGTGPAMDSTPVGPVERWRLPCFVRQARLEFGGVEAHTKSTAANHAARAGWTNSPAKLRENFPIFSELFGWSGSKRDVTAAGRTRSRTSALTRPKREGRKRILQWRPLRQGIADLHRRAEVSQNANNRLLNALSSVDDSRSLDELTADIQKHTKWNGRRVRGLRPWSEDKELFAAVNHGEFLINGFRNRDLQQLLYTTEAESQNERRRRSSAISRKLRLLRAHGITRKVPHTHRYQVTDAGRTVLVALLTAARTSLNQLNQLAKAA